MATTKSINLTVMVDETHRSKLAKVSADLKAKGFVLKDTLQEIGVITGSAPAGVIADLSKVPGVSAVEEERSDYHTQS